MKPQGAVAIGAQPVYPQTDSNGATVEAGLTYRLDLIRCALTGLALGAEGLCAQQVADIGVMAVALADATIATLAAERVPPGPGAQRRSKA